jgi:hypothetical protein
LLIADFPAIVNFSLKTRGKLSYSWYINRLVDFLISNSIKDSSVSVFLPVCRPLASVHGHRASTEVVAIQFQVGGLEIALPHLPCGYFGEKGNDNHEIDTQDYAKYGKTRLWIIIGTAPARKRSPSSNASHRISGSASARRG